MTTFSVFQVPYVTVQCTSAAADCIEPMTPSITYRDTGHRRLPERVEGRLSNTDTLHSLGQLHNENMHPADTGRGATILRTLCRHLQNWSHPAIWGAIAQHLDAGSCSRTKTLEIGRDQQRFGSTSCARLSFSCPAAPTLECRLGCGCKAEGAGAACPSPEEPAEQPNSRDGKQSSEDNALGLKLFNHIRFLITTAPHHVLTQTHTHAHLRACNL